MSKGGVTAVQGESNVLVIAGNGAVALLVQKLLQDSTCPRFRVESATEIFAALKLLREIRFDIVLVDFSWAWAADPAALEKVNIFAPEAAVVLLTDRNAAASRLSNSDYAAEGLLVKGEFDAELLRGVIGRAVARRRFRELPHLYS
jgi:DNA-binding NarL/FixJ family response regulator